MGKLIAVLLVLAALVAEALFLHTGAGHAQIAPNELAQSLGPHLAGQPQLALAGGVLFAVGVLILGRRGDGESYALREVILCLAVAAVAAFTASLFVGVARGWSGPTLAVLGVGAALEILVAVGLGVRLALDRERHKLLFVPGLLGAIGLVALYVLILVKGSV